MMILDSRRVDSNCGEQSETQNEQQPVLNPESPLYICVIMFFHSEGVNGLIEFLKRATIMFPKKSCMRKLLLKSLIAYCLTTFKVRNKPDKKVPIYSFQ